MTAPSPPATPTRRSDPAALTGYTPRLSFAPGDAVPLRLSADGDVRVRLVRLPGAVPVDGVAPLRVPAPGVHGFQPGSYGTATVPVPSDADPDAAACAAGLSCSLWVFPTAPDPAGSVLLSIRRGDALLALGVAGNGGLELLASDASLLPLSKPLSIGALTRHAWHRIEVDIAAGATDNDSISVTVSSPAWPSTRTAASAVPSAGSLRSADGPLSVTLAALGGAGGDTPSRFFDGKLDAVTVAGTRLVLDPRQVSPDIRSSVDGSVCGRLFGSPTRGVTGADWRDAEARWTENPAAYGAAAFARDDLDDAGWPVAATLPLPDDLPSGVYAAELTTDTAIDILPFAVRAAGRVAVRGAEPAADRAAVTVLLPTFTYLAYANEAPFAPHVPVTSDARDEYTAWHGLTSLYSNHADGRGVAYASLLRPLLNLRPDYVYWLTGQPHGLGADLRILEFLEHAGIAYDVITDHDLEEDPSLLGDERRVLVTGSHPEYWSRRGMASLDRWLGRGGRLAYLGGNGLHAMVATMPGSEHVLELRRRGAEVGLWEAAPGEASLAATGEPGGLWRHHSPAPVRLTGLIYTTMGFGDGVGYRMLPAARDDRARFLVEGIPESALTGAEPIGAEALWFGGAVAYECDRADAAHGTPQHALILATSDPLPDSYEAADSSGERRADIVFFETPSGGAVFSVGSIAFAGALPVDDFDNPVATLLGNALRRFADPVPFPFPVP
ncbi:N,N-dimethylformamidase beta subunit family domain-containing protein [Planctomonas psychrotolerans]|uniref:N,N-dimethylformamidase beta subunit family domain-containing protein n=1 Tax=Planctomonas psychrotolerans TaxID=2528712 RepID=UPI00123C12FE|nr:N,N-dimethylformamidase beta subunit family domain-containing protein [Planctomonas psychrotolerans]